MVKFGLTFGYFESVVTAMGSKRHRHFLKALENNEVKNLKNSLSTSN
jgi:hypothetical protein